MTKNKKPGRPMTSGKVVLDRLLDSKTPLTAREAGGSSVIMSRLERSGRIKRSGIVKQSGRRGRPAIKWALEPKIRKSLRDQKRRPKVS
jgi:hypothetical protein